VYPDEAHGALAAHIAGVPDARRVSGPLLEQPVTELAQTGKGLAVLLPVGGLFALNDVINMSDREAISLHAPLPCLREALDVMRLLICQGDAKIPQRGHPTRLG
jgi:hypothetical protein